MSALTTVLTPDCVLSTPLESKVSQNSWLAACILHSTRCDLVSSITHGVTENDVSTNGEDSDNLDTSRVMSSTMSRLSPNFPTGGLSES